MQQMYKTSRKVFTIFEETEWKQMNEQAVQQFLKFSNRAVFRKQQPLYLSMYVNEFVRGDVSASSISLNLQFKFANLKSKFMSFSF